jgi:lipoprotein-anchoring transpeptidase ErfK/SrfK
MKRVFAFLLIVQPSLLLANPAQAQLLNKEPITVLEEIELQKAEQKKLQTELQQIKTPAASESVPLDLPKTNAPLVKPSTQLGYQIPSYIMAQSKRQRLVFIDKSELKLWVIDTRKALQTTRIMIGRNYMPTPSGNFQIYSKERNVSLVGQDYNVPVSYWMPFLRGFGLHDANWRPASHFGNTSVQPTRGSHGCVNLPPSIAPTIYNLVQIGTPVIIIE